MLTQSDFPVEKALELLTLDDIDAALIVPTPTGLGKSILDATDNVRAYLAERGCHDFAGQRQGAEEKVVRDASFVQPGAFERTRIWLYRPITKNGDPRLWIGEANLGALFLPSQNYALT